MKKIIAATTAALSCAVLVPQAAQASNPFNASCDAATTSAFTAPRSGIYAWVWRTGTTVNGYGAQYVRSGDTVEVDTPDGVDGTSKFGVLGSRTKSYSYETCTDSAG